MSRWPCGNHGTCAAPAEAVGLDRKNADGKIIRNRSRPARGRNHLEWIGADAGFERPARDLAGKIFAQSLERHWGRWRGERAVERGLSGRERCLVCGSRAECDRAPDPGSAQRH